MTIRINENDVFELWRNDDLEFKGSMGELLGWLGGYFKPPETRPSGLPMDFGSEEEQLSADLEENANDCGEPLCCPGPRTLTAADGVSHQANERNVDGDSFGSNRFEIGRCVCEERWPTGRGRYVGNVHGYLDNNQTVIKLLGANEFKVVDNNNLILYT